MEINKYIRYFMKIVTAGLFGYVVFSAEISYAISAEYKCTSQCNLCINFGKKTVCSEKYDEDTMNYEKAKKLSRFVNEGLIVPSLELKPGFQLEAFANKFFDCELMVKKAAQIQEATQNMCVKKTVKYQKTVLVPRAPASVKKATVQKPAPAK